jgi:hypothetical protein
MSRRPWWGGVRTVTRWGRRRIGIAIRRRIGVRTGRIGRSIIRIVEARSMWRRSMWRIRMMGVRRWRSMRRWTGRDMYWRRTLARWTRLALELNDGLANIPFFVHRRSNARHRTTAPFLLLGTLRPQQCICRRLCRSHIQSLSQCLTRLGLGLFITHLKQPSVSIVSPQKPSASFTHHKHHATSHQGLLAPTRHEIRRLKISYQGSVASIAHLRVGTAPSTTKNVVFAHLTRRFQYGDRGWGVDWR